MPSLLGLDLGRYRLFFKTLVLSDGPRKAKTDLRTVPYFLKTVAQLYLVQQSTD
jgi:hypothetical protein